MARTNKSLNELEGVAAKKPAPDEWNLVTKCLLLRAKPLDQFNVEGLRLMIGQKIGLQHLIPLAFEVLDQDPLIEGDYYRGDLLASVIGAVEWLRMQPELYQHAVRLAERALLQLGDSEDSLKRDFAHFIAKGGTR